MVRRALLAACMPLTAIWLMAASAPAAPNWPPNGVCIRSPDVVQTTRPDDNTILFRTRDHAVWKNTLLARCFGLSHPEESFTFQPTDPGTEELCSGQVTIKLNIDGSVCQLGNFTRVK